MNVIYENFFEILGLILVASTCVGIAGEAWIEAWKKKR